MSVEEVMGYTITPFDLEREEAWAEGYTQAVETARANGSMLNAYIPGYGSLNELTYQVFKEMQLRMERVALYHNAGNMILKVEKITRMLTGEFPMDDAAFDGDESALEETEELP